MVPLLLALLSAATMCCFGCRSVCCKGIKEDARESILFSKLAMRPWITNVVIILIASGVHQIDSRLYPGTYKALETFLHFDPIQLGALSLGQNLAGNIVRATVVFFFASGSCCVSCLSELQARSNHRCTTHNVVLFVLRLALFGVSSVRCTVKSGCCLRPLAAGQ